MENRSPMKNPGWCRSLGRARDHGFVLVIRMAFYWTISGMVGATDAS
jgi:hypothetical protein